MIRPTFTRRHNFIDANRNVAFVQSIPTSKTSYVILKDTKNTSVKFPAASKNIKFLERFASILENNSSRVSNILKNDFVQFIPFLSKDDLEECLTWDTSKPSPFIEIHNRIITLWWYNESLLNKNNIEKSACEQLLKANKQSLELFETYAIAFQKNFDMSSTNQKKKLINKFNAIFISINGYEVLHKTVYERLLENLSLHHSLYAIARLFLPQAYRYSPLDINDISKCMSSVTKIDQMFNLVNDPVTNSVEWFEQKESDNQETLDILEQKKNALTECIQTEMLEESWIKNKHYYKKNHMLLLKAKILLIIKHYETIHNHKNNKDLSSTDNLQSYINNLSSIRKNSY